MKKILQYTGIMPVIACLLVFSSSIATSCNTTEPPPPKNNGALTLTLTETSCTEAWVNIKAQNISFPAQINFLLDNKALRNISLTSSDTTIYIDSLLPNKTYQLVAQYTNNTGTASSNQLTVQTLDTTSNNFSFSTYTFGDPGAGSSHLSDVAIINENNIWAVGEIYMNDSTGKPDPQPYSIAKWDGQKWKLKKLFYNTNMIITSIRGLLVLSPNDIWLAAGSIFHWDGVSSSAQLVYSRLNLPDPNATIEKLWGNSPTLIYGVGYAGTIVFYNGSSWQKIESGTNLPIYGIWGNSDFNNKVEIIAVASDKYFTKEKIVLGINTAAQAIADSGLPWSLSSIWFTKNKYYIVGDGIYVKNFPNENWQNITGNITTFYSQSVRGSALNDIVISGAGGDVAHFNGVTWKDYRNNGLPAFFGNYFSVSIKGNIICAVGEAVFNSDKAIIALGTR